MKYVAFLLFTNGKKASFMVRISSERSGYLGDYSVVLVRSETFGQPPKMVSCDGYVREEESSISKEEIEQSCRDKWASFNIETNPQL